MGAVVPTSAEKAILGHITSTMNDLIAKPIPNAFGDTEQSAWLAYARLKSVFRVLLVAWAKDRCSFSTETKDAIAEINWKIRMLDAVDPIAPKAAVNASATRPSLPVSRTLPAPPPNAPLDAGDAPVVLA